MAFPGMRICEDLRFKNGIGTISAQNGNAVWNAKFVELTIQFPGEEAPRVVFVSREFLQRASEL